MTMKPKTHGGERRGLFVFDLFLVDLESYLFRRRRINALALSNIRLDGSGMLISADCQSESNRE